MGGETKPDRMNFSDLTKIAVDRIQKLEQINFRKIMGFILLNEPSETEMMQLAYGPETALISRIDEIKAMLRNLSPRNASFSQGSRSFSSPSAFHIPAEYWDQLPLGYAVSTEEDCSIPNLAKFFNLDENYCYQDAALGGSIPLRSSGRSPSLPEFPIKPCHYYYKGYCKHGVNCRYFHGPLCFPDGHVQAFSPSFNELQSEDHGLSPGSLEQLESEITELLRARRGVPVSIASLPLLYYETYGKNLQADGYLTESQRHGKAGFSLTKLLARLKSSIRLIDRPHGQHSVILAECVPKFLEWRNERNEAGSTAMSSHQIYLTFPAESTFTEDDVSNYFKQFGPVKDVRIPCQAKRMFGFVSFVYPETVNEILLKRVPHYICGARVLVKPYREKSRIHTEKIKSAMHHPSYYVDWDSELQALVPREFESSRGLKMHMEEQENLLELERTHLAEFNLEQKPLDQQSKFSHGVDNLKLQVPDEYPLEEHFSYTREALNVGSSTDDKTRNTGNGCTNLERGRIALPENPFASPPLPSSISTVI